MKATELNTIANTIAAEKKAAEKAAEAKKEAEILASVKEGTYVEFLEDVIASIINPITDSCDNVVGIMSHPHVTSIKCAKMVNGHLCVGANEEELKKDILDLKIFMKKYGSKAMSYYRKAVELIAWGRKPDQIVERRGEVYYVLADECKVIDSKGHCVIELDASKYHGAPASIVAELLVAKLEAAIC